jgi:hypothetical protein
MPCNDLVKSAHGNLARAGYHLLYVGCGSVLLPAPGAEHLQDMHEHRRHAMVMAVITELSPGVCVSS